MNQRKIRVFALVEGYPPHETIHAVRLYSQRDELEPLRDAHNARIRPRADGIRIGTVYIRPLDVLAIEGQTLIRA